MNELSTMDALALGSSMGNGRGNGFGNGDGFWIILLFILLGGWGNRGFGGNGAGSVGGNELYPWLNQTGTINGGFRDQMLQSGISGIQQSVTTGFANAANQLCQCCSEMQMAIANGFFGVESAASARQMANMQQMFGMQTAIGQGFNSLQAQTAQLAADLGLGMANQTATILAEHCADRAALSDGIRDVIAAQNAGIQRISDQLYQYRMQDKDETIAQLRQQVQMQSLAASQNAQTAQILANNEAQTTALEQYLAPVPRPCYVVQNPNCCGQTYGCGCMAA